MTKQRVLILAITALFSSIALGDIPKSGATYYANSLKGVGFPDMSAAVAMSAGDEYLAGVSELATIGLLGLGALNLFRRKRRA
jgi:hypothetical protein